MGWFSDIVNTVGDAVQQVVDTVDHAINVAADHPIETTALVVAAPYAYTAATASEGLAAITAPVSSGSVIATELPALSEVATISNAEAAKLIAAETATATSPITSTSFLPSTLTAKDVLTATNTGLNVATAGLKLATLSSTGKLMNATTATADGLTGALAASPIQTPSGLITTTPNGPVVAGTSVPATTTDNNQTMMVIVGAAIGIFLLSKYAKG